MSDKTEDTDNEDQEAKLDMGQAEQLLFFQDAAIGGSASFQAAAQSRANFAQRLPGTSDWTIGGGVVSLDQLTPIEREERERQEAADWLDTMMAVVERQQKKLEREREEWSQSQHSYAGIEMTGEEWGEFADKLKGDTPLRKWLLEKLKKEGKTDAKATEMADQMAMLAKMQSLPPNQWTPEMKALDQKLEADPALKRELQSDLRDAKKFASDFQVAGRKVEQSADTGATSTTISTDAGASILSEESGAPQRGKSNSFASTIDGSAIQSTLDLGVHHKAALAAKVPLDAPKQIAALTPPPPTPSSPGGGFDG